MSTTTYDFLLQKKYVIFTGTNKEVVMTTMERAFEKNALVYVPMHEEVLMNTKFPIYFVFNPTIDNENTLLDVNFKISAIVISSNVKKTWHSSGYDSYCVEIEGCPYFVPYEEEYGICGMHYKSTSNACNTVEVITDEHFDVSI